MLFSRSLGMSEATEEKAASDVTDEAYELSAEARIDECCCG
jgi:hypothetical protein